jgi:UDP-N-acetylglucosamine enolpyruvyl transferase
LNSFKKEGGVITWFYYDCWSLLARFGKGYIPKPGGDKIGEERYTL